MSARGIRCEILVLLSRSGSSLALRGLLISPLLPTLAPWAALCGRFEASTTPDYQLRTEN